MAMRIMGTACLMAACSGGADGLRPADRDAGSGGSNAGIGGEVAGSGGASIEVGTGGAVASGGELNQGSGGEGASGSGGLSSGGSQDTGGTDGSGGEIGSGGVLYSGGTGPSGGTGSSSGGDAPAGGASSSGGVMGSGGAQGCGWEGSEIIEIPKGYCLRIKDTVQHAWSTGTGSGSDCVVPIDQEVDCFTNANQEGSPLAETALFEYIPTTDTHITLRLESALSLGCNGQCQD